MLNVLPLNLTDIKQLSTSVRQGINSLIHYDSFNIPYVFKSRFGGYYFVNHCLASRVNHDEIGQLEIAGNTLDFYVSALRALLTYRLLIING